MLEIVYNPTTTIALKFINLQHNLVISYMKLVMEFVDVDGLEHLRAEPNSWICLASALAKVCPSMAGLMLWITSFNRCRMSLLLLLLNVFLKVRAVYFKAESTISGAFQCSACSAGAPPTCTSSTISFLGVEDPFLDEVVPSRAF